MKYSTSMLGAALIMGTGSQVVAALSDAEFQVFHSDIEGCMISGGSCFDQGNNNFVFAIQDKSTCGLVGYEWSSPQGMGSWNALKLATLAKEQVADQSEKQIMLARLSPTTKVNSGAMSALFADDTVAYEDYIRCRTTGTEFVYLYGTPANVAAKMANAATVGLKFEPSTPLLVPDILKIDPMISKDFEVPTPAVQMALADHAASSAEDASIIAQNVQLTLNNNRRRRRRLAGVEHSEEDTVKVVAKSHRVLEAVNFEVADMLIGGENLSGMNSVKFVSRKPSFEFSNFDAGLYIQSQTSLANGASTNVDETTTRPFWAAGVDGTGQVVGVGDTGLDYDHCFFSDGPVSIATGETKAFPDHRKLAQYFAFTSPREDTNSGHGSHVSGTVAGDPSSGTSVHKGVAYKARIALADLSEDARSVNVPDEISLMFNHAKDVDGFIHTNSWGDASETTMDVTARQVDEYQWLNQDYLTLFAAGNSGYRSGSRGSIGSPAVSKNCVTVGAQLNSDRSWGGRCPNSQSPCTEGLASFSSNGPLFDGRISPDVVGFGHRVTSARSSISGTSCSTMAISGTSMATPAVAGAAALVRQFYMDGYYPTGSAVAENKFTPLAALVKATLINSGNLLSGRYGSRALNSQVNNFQGFGAVSLGNTLPVANSIADNQGRSLFVVGDNNNRLNMNTGDSETYSFQVTDDNVNSFKVTLVWTDAPAAIAASSALINNIDLKVTTPSGEVIYPNLRDSPDDVNNVEQVLVLAEDVETGTYTVEVSAVSVAVGPQPIALVASGKFTTGPTLPPSPTIPTDAPTPFPTPSEEECEDTPGWYDSDGPTYDCEWYSQGTRCQQFGHNYENFGQVANEACCVCKETASRSSNLKYSADAGLLGEESGGGFVGVASLAGGVIGGLFAGAAAVLAVTHFRKGAQQKAGSSDSFSDFRVSNAENAFELNNSKF